MKFLLSSLPSKGLTIKNNVIDGVEISPLTYKQLVNFTNNIYENDIDRTIAEINCFIKDIPNWEILSAYDLSCLVFTREYISATYEDELILTIGDSKFNVSMADITFKEINDELLQIKSIELRDQVFPFKIPTISDYYSTLISVSSKLDSKDFWLNKYDCMILAAMGLNEINAYELIDTYANAVGDDIITIKYIDRLLNNTTNDITVKGQGGDNRVVSITKHLPDIFQLIQDNRVFNSSKIKFSKKL